MRNAVNNRLSDTKFSSPLPSPRRHSMNRNNDNLLDTQHGTTSLLPLDETDNFIKLPPIVLTQPNDLNSDTYPLSSLETPQSLRKFAFKMNGKLGLFEELQDIPIRKRSASWEDERSHKRKELNNNELGDTPTYSSATTDAPHHSTVNTYSSPGVAFPTSESTLDIIPDSPNSALPSPVSDLDPEDAWPIPYEDEPEDTKDEDSNAITKLHNTTTPSQPMHHHNNPSHIIGKFETLPNDIQSYFLFQLLKRSSRSTLRMASDTILHSLKTDILTHLPTPLTHRILSYLDIRSLCRASAVSKAWKDIIGHASDVWQYKMVESDFVPTRSEKPDSKDTVRRHFIMRRNWRHNLHHKILLDGHEDDLVTCLQFDDEKIITGSDDHSIRVYDIHTGKLQRVLNGHDGGVWALQYVGNTLVTGSIDRTVRVWNIETGKCHFVLRGHTSTVRCLKIIMPSEIIQPNGSVSIEPSEPIIVSGSRDMTIRVWRLPDITKPAKSSNDDMVSKEYLKFKLVEHEHSVRDLAVYGNILVSGSYDNNVVVWDLETGEKVHLLQGHTMKVYCVAIDPKHRHCISGSLDASIRIWGLDDGECKYVLQGHAILVGLLGLVDDCLVSAAADTTLRVWDASNGDRLRILAGPDGHQGPITSFQHDKYKIVSGSEGGVKMWDTKTGKFMYNLIEDVAGVWRVCFDERRCIAAVKNEHRTQLIVLDFGVHGIEDDRS